MTRTFSWISAILILPILGWFSLTPLLVAFPIYADELEWKLMTSRLFLDGGKLHYIFPECARGRLLDMPISWYPLELINSALYADMSNPQILRYGGLLMFCGLIGYCTLFIRLRLRPDVPVLTVCGAVLAPISIGVVPFLVVLNRPEQSLVVILVIACTIPLIVGTRVLSPLQTWLLALSFGLMSWLAVATHAKGIFILPALLLAAFLTLRDWRPFAAVAATTAFGAWETFRVWRLRTDCPESPFLDHIFRGASLSPEDLHHGTAELLMQVVADLRGLKAYWLSAGFQAAYQGSWLPANETPRTTFESALNAAIPLLMAIATAIIVRAFVVAVSQSRRERRCPDCAAMLSACLLACVLGIAAFQKGKNFYESSLIIPMLGLAVMLVLPRGPSRVGSALLGGIAVIAVASQITLAWRLYPHLDGWNQALADRPRVQQRIRRLVDRCGLKIDNATSNLLVDPSTYTVLWPTRDPYFLHYVYSWWGTGLDPQRTLRDAGITGAVGECRFVPPDQWASIVSDGNICCAKG